MGEGTVCCVHQVNANELTNGVINAAFMLLFKDSIRLFAAYNEGVINLLGKTPALSPNVKHLHTHISLYTLLNLLKLLPENVTLDLCTNNVMLKWSMSSSLLCLQRNTLT